MLIEVIKSKNNYAVCHAYTGHESTYVEILNSFNPEVQLKDNNLAVRNIFWLKWEGLNLLQQWF